MKLLPLGIQDFASIIQGGFVYVDKTRLIYQMIQTGRTYFLSRPRRFGKSLLVSTLDALFSGKKELFKDLWIASSDHDWKEYRVIALDFSMLMTESYESLCRTLQNQLQSVADRYELGDVRQETPPETLITLVVRLAKEGQVVLLIDEYDKPILDHIDQPEQMSRYRELFKAFYSNVKGLGKYLRFTFLTGVTKFAQVSLFSGMNNPEDISLIELFEPLD